jgi:putative transposase
MNRGSRKGVLFETADDYLAFARLVAEARELRPMRINAYCLMVNHWHFLLWPQDDGDLSRFMHWLTGTHAQRWRRARGTTGQGAVYQSRFTARPIVDVLHLMTAWRYIERNPVEAGLVARAEDWRWSSAHHLVNCDVVFALDPAPCGLPQEWLAIVNEDEWSANFQLMPGEQM